MTAVADAVELLDSLGQRDLDVQDRHDLTVLADLESGPFIG